MTNYTKADRTKAKKIFAGAVCSGHAGLSVDEMETHWRGALALSYASPHRRAVAQAGIDYINFKNNAKG